MLRTRSTCDQVPIFTEQTTIGGGAFYKGRFQIINPSQGYLPFHLLHPSIAGLSLRLPPDRPGLEPRCSASSQARRLLASTLAMDICSCVQTNPQGSSNEAGGKAPWKKRLRLRFFLRSRIQRDVEEVFGADQNQPAAQLILSHLNDLVRDDRLERALILAMSTLSLGIGVMAAWWLAGLQVVYPSWWGQVPSGPDQQTHVVKSVLTFCGFMAGALCYVLGIKAGVWLQERRAPVWLSAGVPLLAPALLALPRAMEALLHHPLSHRPGLEFVYRTGLRCAILWSTVTLCVYALIPVLSYTRHLQMVYRPNFYFAYHLFRALVVLRRLPAMPAAGLLDESGVPTSFLGSLESAAQALEALPRRYVLSSASRRNWATEAYAGRAQAVRELGRWFLLPRTDTLPHLQAKLHAVLQTVAAGNWDGLETLAPDAVALSRWRRGASLLRSLLITAVVPASALLLRELHLPGWEVVTQSLLLVAVPWVTIHLSVLLNPGLRPKLAGFQAEVATKAIETLKGRF